MRFDDLLDFVQHQMRMSHIYQPLLIKTPMKPEDRTTVLKVLARIAEGLAGPWPCLPQRLETGAIRTHDCNSCGVYTRPALGRGLGGGDAAPWQTHQRNRKEDSDMKTVGWIIKYCGWLFIATGLLYGIARGRDGGGIILIVVGIALAVAGGKVTKSGD